MGDSSTSDAELLQYAIKNGMIDPALVQDKIEMQKREEILKEHKYSIWHSESEDVWYTYLPDEKSNRGIKRIKRKDEKSIKDAIYRYYVSAQDLKNKKSIESMTLDSLFHEYMTYKTDKVSSGTIKRMAADWQKFYVPEKDLVSKPFTQITKIEIDDFFNKVLDEHHLKKKAFYNMCGILKQCFQYAIDAEYTEKTPYRTNVNKKKFAGSPKKPSKLEVYQEDERDLFIAEMERRLTNNPANTAPIAIMLDFELGTRKGEILAISESDISGDHIHIHRQVVEEWNVSDLNKIKSRGFKIVEYTKTADGDRVLPLTDRAKQLIQKAKEINAEYGNAYKDFLFVKNGYIMSPDALDAQVKRGCEYIGIPVKTMHKIRKTYASTLLHNGVNLSIVKDVLGHADESTTLRHYIFNVETDAETEKSILSALNRTSENPADNEGTQGDTKIIVFGEKKKTKNPIKSRLSVYK